MHLLELSLMIVYVACLSGIEFEQVFIIAWLQLFTFSFFGIQISEAGLNLINWFDSAADRTLISTPYVMIFPVFNELG